MEKTTGLASAFAWMRSYLLGGDIGRDYPLQPQGSADGPFGG